jgi:flagellar hook-associated protein 3 FlgL
MPINRVSNFALLNGTLNDVSDVQKQLANLQDQISSGLKSKDFQGLGGKVEQYAQLEAKIRSAANYEANNDVGVARLQTADTALKQMIDIVDDMENLIIQARGPVGDTSGLRRQMEENLKTLASQLNTTFNGKYIFSGTNTTQAPVPDALAEPLENGVPDDGYYAGSTDDVTYSADEHLSYAFPARADDAAFQKIFAAAQQAMRAFSTNDDANLRDAVALMQEGQTGLVAVRSNVNNTIINVKATNERLGALQLYWKGLNESVANTDLVAASTQVASYEAILQATFSVYSRLSQLRLSDYLR